MQSQLCGWILLRNVEKTADFTLHLKESTRHVHIRCHRAVLISHSPVFFDLLTDENYFYVTVHLYDGHIKAMVELIRYMYLGAPCLITERDTVLDLAARLDMALTFEHMERFAGMPSLENDPPPGPPVLDVEPDAGEAASPVAEEATEEAAPAAAEPPYQLRKRNRCNGPGG